MTSLEAVILGAIQGLTEFLPISSSGHLVLAHRVLGVEEDNLTFDIWLHVGTLLAVLIAYRRDLQELLVHPRSPVWKWLILGTIPTGILGYLLHDPVEALFQSGSSLPWEFAITGIVLYLAETLPRGNKRIENLRASDALWVGVFQGLAIMPALSRSGLTLAGALWRGMDRTEAAKYSFLLSIPAIAGAALQEWVSSTAAGGAPGLPEILGAGTAAAAGYMAIFWMLKILATRSMRPFAWYVWILGAVVLALQWSGRL